MVFAKLVVKETLTRIFICTSIVKASKVVSIHDVNLGEYNVSINFLDSGNPQLRAH